MWEKSKFTENLFKKTLFLLHFTFLILRILKSFTLRVCEKFVYKHTETIENVKK